MKTAGRENPNRGVALPRNRAHGAAGQNRSRSNKWAEKQENFQSKEMCFLLTSFIELHRWELAGLADSFVQPSIVSFVVVPSVLRIVVADLPLLNPVLGFLNLRHGHLFS